MKYSYVVLAVLSVILIITFYGMSPTNQDIATDERVARLLSEMTLDEKVGQMTQVTLSLVMPDDRDDQIDLEKLRFAILEKKVGSILNVNGHAYSIDQWHKILTDIQDVAKESRLGIPILYGIDAIHGANYVSNGTVFPHNIGMAAARNHDLVEEIAKITAKETRASGIRWNFDPTLGIGRQPLWSRFEETFGEDVYLTSSLGASAIKGYEGDGINNINGVASCMKHFIGYSAPSSGKDRTPAYIPDTQLREYFLPPFEAAVKAGTSTIMINSAEINGVPVHASSYYLKDILRDELGFKGLAVSDWEDVIRLYSRHRIAATPKEAVKLAVNAGIDMSMVPLDYSFYDYLVELVNEGEVSIERIDEAVGRILQLKLDLGLFDNPYPEKSAVANFGKEEYQQTAKTAALETLTLLKKENEVLPLKEGTKVLLAGPTANAVTPLHSSWSYKWQGDDAQYYPDRVLTVYEALVKRNGSDDVICRSVEDFADPKNYDSKALLRDAKAVDAIVLCLGEKAYAESPGVIDDLEIDDNQIALAKAAISTGKPVVLVLIQGRPRLVSSFVDDIEGVLLAYRPGNQGADAITDVLFGDYNPNGRLPFTYPKYSGDIVPYDHKYSERIREDIPDTYSDGAHRPQWPFGHGLSYTTFAYSNLSIDQANLKPGSTLEASIDVTNTGKIDGMTSVELYTKDLYASITPSFKRLKGIKKINLKAGETKRVKFNISPEDLSFINAQGNRVTETGDFELLIGDQQASFKYESGEVTN